MLDSILCDVPADGIVIRIGGNVLTPRGAIGFDHQNIASITDFIREMALASLKIAIVPGGAGGNVFIELARALDCSDALMNEVGCTLIDMSAMILADYLSRMLEQHGISCCPRAATGIQELKMLREDYQVVVSSSHIAGALTSDSLSLLIAEAISNPVISIKRNIQFSDIGTSAEPLGMGISILTIDAIDRHIAAMGLVEQPGWHPTLDVWALRLLRRPEIQLYLTSIDGVRKFLSSGQISPLLKVVAS